MRDGSHSLIKFITIDITLRCGHLLVCSIRVFKMDFHGIQANMIVHHQQT